MRLAWATDIHLNFLTATDRRRFLESVRGQMDALVISGDIAESNSVGEMLRQIDAWLERPVYFVLGNHDCYRGSVAGTRASVSEMVNVSKNLVYLSGAGVVELTLNTCLVGHDGWTDARLGDCDTSADGVKHCLKKHKKPAPGEDAGFLLRVFPRERRYADSQLPVAHPYTGVTFSARGPLGPRPSV